MLISIFCFGNPSRGDDAAGEHMHEWLDRAIQSGSITGNSHKIRLVLDFQLEPEHIFDLDGSDLGIFIDCHLSIDQPFLWLPVDIGQQLTITSHSVTTESLLFLFENTLKKKAPPCYLLGIGGDSFGLGEPISASTQRNIEAAQEFLEKKLNNHHISAFK